MFRVRAFAINVSCPRVPHTYTYISHAIQCSFIIHILSQNHLLLFLWLWQQEGAPQSGFLLTTTASKAEALPAEVPFSSCCCCSHFLGDFINRSDHQILSLNL